MKFWCGKGLSSHKTRWRRSCGACSRRGRNDILGSGWGKDLCAACLCTMHARLCLNRMKRRALPGRILPVLLGDRRAWLGDLFNVLLVGSVCVCVFYPCHATCQNSYQKKAMPPCQCPCRLTVKGLHNCSVNAMQPGPKPSPPLFQ